MRLLLTLLVVLPFLLTWHATGRPCDRRYFVIGFPKAGTTSLTKALQSASIKTVHYRFKKSYVGSLIAQSAQTGSKLLRAFPAEIKGFGEMSVCNKGHVHWPQLIFVPLLDMQYPCSKFILNVRNFSDHIRSINAWGHLRQQFVDSDIPYLPAGKGAKDTEIISWMSRHYESVRTYFQGRTSDFLEIDIGDPQDEVRLRLIEFLNASVEWGIHNRNEGRDQTG